MSMADSVADAILTQASSTLLSLCESDSMMIYGFGGTDPEGARVAIVWAIGEAAEMLEVAVMRIKSKLDKESNECGHNG